MLRNTSSWPRLRVVTLSINIPLPHSASKRVSSGLGFSTIFFFCSAIRSAPFLAIFFVGWSREIVPGCTISSNYGPFRYWAYPIWRPFCWRCPGPCTGSTCCVAAVTLLLLAAFSFTLHLFILVYLHTLFDRGGVRCFL